jgi:dipeptidyl aminopeptidase/acylaminoacyl peptidase
MMIIAAAVVAATLAASQAAAAKHPMGTADYAALRSAQAVAVAPDGAILVRIDFGGSEGLSRHEWKLLRADGTGRRLHLPGSFRPFGLTRSGALYGGYPAAGHEQLAIVPMPNGDEPVQPAQLILLPQGIHSALLSPDGSRFAVLASPGPPDLHAAAHTVVEPRRTSLYVVGADGTGGTWWCPSLANISDGPIAGGSLAWSPDGASIAVVSATPKIGVKEIRSSIDVCAGPQTKHVVDVPTSVGGLAWTTDGSIAFLGTTTNVLTPDHVWTVPAQGGRPEDRTPGLKGSATSMAADPHGNIRVVVARGVQSEIDSFAGGSLTPLYRWPDGTVVGLPVFSELTSAAPQLALTVADPTHTANVAVPADRELKRITTEGDDQIARIDLGAVRVVKWTSAEGIALEGIATFPAGYQAGRRYPFLVLPHGGPESNDTLRFDTFSRIIAGLGYVVLQPEYRGSTGYGSEFLQAIYQHFGDRAYRDVNSATDFAIAQGWADPDRLAMFGWSAGGFMTSWTVTQTGRYRAAIEGAGITDWGSFMWTSDVQQWDFDARWPDRDPQAFQQFSAVMFADKVTTPLLILHGEADERVPTYQGREFFESLAARGKTTRLVTFPKSGHFPSLWEQRIDVFREIAEWLAKYDRPSGL